MAEPSNSWMPLDEWHALVAGDDCPMCKTIASEERIDAYGYTVADLQLSRLRLARNQWVPGYAVLICTRHVREPYHLELEEQSLFCQDLMRAADALDRVFRPDKMNLQILGNAIPHLHVHIVPRYYGDPAPGRPIDPHGEIRMLRANYYEQQARIIRGALKLAGQY